MKQRPFDYKQTDKRWAKVEYSSHGDKMQTIASSGSGPTLAADVIATLVDNSVTPPEMARLSVSLGCRTYSSGTSWDYFKKVAEHYRFPRFAQSNDFKWLKDCLDHGGLVICSMNRGYWCKVPNYILAWNYDDVYVHCVDSCSHIRNKQRIDNFKKESRMYFCFYPE